MGDEAEAEIARRMSLPRVVTEKGYTQVALQALKAVFLAQKNEGHKKGFAAARSQLLMQCAEWLSTYSSDISPIWIAHVAVEKFKCGCILSADYDGVFEPDVCSKWVSATQEQKLELFQNVYGYSYEVYLAKQRQEQERRAAEMRRLYEDQKGRAEQQLRTDLEAQNINPELLP
jgi:hypothetical protein